MPPVKRQNHTGRNLVQDRLLLVARLTVSAGVKPSLANLERAVGLTTGSLKDCVRRESVSKPVAAALLDAAPRLGLVGLTTDWLVHDRGDPPRRGGELPLPGMRVAEAGDQYPGPTLGGEARLQVELARWEIESARGMALAERDQIPPEILIRLTHSWERIGAQFDAAHARRFMDEVRAGIRKRFKLHKGSAATSS